MNDTVLERMIKSYLQTEQDTYIFTWQGGEPTLMGLDFFQRVVALQQKYGQSGSIVANGLQTNATLLSDEMCRFFHRFQFLVGCSLDGPAPFHNRYRLSLSGNPTHEAVINGINKLRQNRVECNVMTLVSQANVRHGAEIYSYFKELGFMHHQYIPCVEFNGKGQLQPYALHGEEWGNFLCQLFDAWYPDDIHTVSVRLFDTILSKMVDNAVNSCTIGRNCRQYFVVEHNGDIYPCDFFVKKEYLLGNILDTCWQKLCISAIYTEFGGRKARWCSRCNACQYIELCAGDCIRHRMADGATADGHSVLCRGWQQFFNHAHRDLHYLAHSIRSQRVLNQVQSVSWEKN